LDRELRNNFATNIEELSAQKTKTFEHTLKIEKKKKLKVTKLLTKNASRSYTKQSEALRNSE
jgi:hypothetical protein